MDDLLELLDLKNHPQVTMQITAAEKVARWIAAAAPILLMLGLLGIWVEIKTPGFGLPGLLGIACLALVPLLASFGAPGYTRLALVAGDAEIPRLAVQGFIPCRAPPSPRRTR